MKRLLTTVFPALVIGIAGALFVLHAWGLPPFTSAVQMTDNAYVRGAVTTISPQVSGYIVDIPLQDYAEVHEGDLIARIDDRSYRARLEQARATLASAQAALANLELTRASREASIVVATAQIHNAQAGVEKAQLDLNRILPLLASQVQSRATGDNARVALRQAEAALEQARASHLVAERALAETQGQRQNLQAAVEGAEAAVHLAEIDLANTRVVAPRNGRLGEIGARVGQYVSPGTQVTALVPDQVWVIANYKETQIAGMRPGQVATLRVDALGGLALTGHVERFSPAAGSEFSVIRADNATGNFTKVAQRMPVRIAIDPGQAMAGLVSPGMSVVVSIDTDQGSQGGMRLGAREGAQPTAPRPQAEAAHGVNPG
ncbi:HlyD family secretion protein [Rhodovarius crocodyli]|uniref:HlyD family secretion protein n=1 Tax=Rhodovarius crocodyli TaxID=1979269 RepID=A0A437MPD6_9PROT|nr:HlyD family secretion protein [Rhodovarius crocodyli]RVT99507.1 HlyD family secretion protein [Rhodovarius crocodyli]